MQDTKVVVKRYCCQAVLILIVLTSLFALAGPSLLDGFTVTALTVCAVYSLVVEGADIMIWQRVAKVSPDMLTTFYSAASGFRMLSALAVMFVYYLASDSNMMTFLLVFAVYYFSLLAHHAIFFARLTNGDKLKK